MASSMNFVLRLVLKLDSLEYPTNISDDSIFITKQLPYGTETMAVHSIDISEKATSSLQIGDSFDISNGYNPIEITAENGAV